MNISKQTRVAVKIRYNGHLHSAIALKGTDVDGRSSIHIFFDQLPKGYHDEHGSHQIDYVFGTDCITLDLSGEHGWITSEIVDLDFFADKEQIIE